MEVYFPSRHKIWPYWKWCPRLLTVFNPFPFPKQGVFATNFLSSKRLSMCGNVNSISAQFSNNDRCFSLWTHLLVMSSIRVLRFQPTNFIQSPAIQFMFLSVFWWPTGMYASRVKRVGHINELREKQLISTGLLWCSNEERRR